MASILDYGAGAYSGLQDQLEEELKRQAQARADAQLQETIRSNHADEDYRGKALEESTAYRKAQQESLQETRDANILNQRRDDLRTRAGLRAAGDPVSDSEYTDEINIGGIPMSRYKREPKPYQPLPDGLEGPAQQQVDTTFLGMPTKPGQPANLQRETFLLDGKPVDGEFNPDTGKRTYQGQDVTARAKHYEKPPSEVGIWTDKGYVPRNDALNSARGGNPVQPQETAATRTMGEGARMLQPHIDDLKDQASGLEAAGMFGPVMSRIRHLAETAGTIDGLNDAIAADPELGKDRRIGKFATSLGLLATGAGRVHGGARGGGSPQMLQHFKSLLNDSASLEMFLGRLDAIDDYMTTYAGGPGGADAPPSSGSSVPQVGGIFQGGRVLRVTPIP